MSAKLIDHPPDEQGWRRARYDGVAHRPADIRVLLAEGWEPSRRSSREVAPEGGWRVVCTVALGGGPEV
ncbi:MULTISPECIES: hypothetical protein [unclassified Streptomyces]|uniref:hypothetical protein n=1 Tax=unclassified Streptomyces TaxID=2593676 RepID=UPI0004BDD1DC|nr:MULTISPECIES: hypothetical protein [unclassified Streptomyces]